MTKQELIEKIEANKKPLAIYTPLIFIVLYFLFIFVTLPDVDEALESGITPSPTSQILASDNSVIKSYGRFHFEPVYSSDLSPTLLDALFSTEDRRFYDHNGLDSLAILRAFLRNAISSRTEGGSTITQQLARNVFLSHKRTLTRKIKEAILALELERKLSKDQILVMYLNNVYFGEGAYGLGAASQIYFGKNPKHLNTSEAALLVSLLKAPSRYNPYENPDLATVRRNIVLENMVDAGKLTEKEATGLKRRSIHLDPSERRAYASNIKAQFFSQYVLKQVLAELDMDEQTFWHQGIKVYTTLDRKAQQIAESQIIRMNQSYGRVGKENQAALYSIDSDGRVVAYVGGQNFTASQYDRVSQAHRSAGSLFKVFVYTAAMEKGISPLAVYEDSAVKFGDWEPQNYDKGHYGLMTLAQALVRSNNIVAVKLIKDVSPSYVINTAQKMGIKSPMEPNLALALGAVDVSLEEMTAAFNVLNNMGVYVEPYAIEKIVGRDNKVLYEHEPDEGHEVISRSVRDTMVQMMEWVIQHGTGRAAMIGRQAAGKTGTSDDYRNAWFIGFTPGVTTGVWVGNDNNTPMNGITGGTLPANIWAAYMSQYVGGKSDQGFEIVQANTLEGKDFYTLNVEEISGEELVASWNQKGAGIKKAFKDMFSNDPGRKYAPTPPSGSEFRGLHEWGMVTEDTSNNKKEKKRYKKERYYGDYDDDD